MKPSRNAIARWRAVMNRDSRADGAFVFAVSTTGIFCRPTCPARRPRRAHVQFYDACADAERAGFRACKRCNPRGPSSAAREAALVAAACRTLASAETVPTLAALAAAAKLSPFHFHRIFTRAVGLTPKAYATAQRAERVRRELPQRDTVTDALYAAGFNTGGRFYAQASRALGMRPKRYARGGAGETIRFATGRSSLGAILVATSQRGICHLALGDDTAALIRELRARFPAAHQVAADKGFARVVKQAIGCVETPRRGAALPLDLRGTVFQQRVWRALQQIPAGRTMHYAELAARIGMPTAARAVAGACAANTIAVAVPCHRVVRRDGSLSGYRWGVARKRALLQREGVSATTQT